MIRIDRLYVNGCSWTEGHFLHEEAVVQERLKELDYFCRWDENNIFVIDSHKVKFIEYPYRFIYDEFNWAGHLAKKIGAGTIINDAVGAGSNSRMVRKTIDFILNSSEEELSSTMIVLAWTMPERSEMYLTDDKGFSSWARFNVSQKFSSLENLYSSDFLKKIDKFWQMYIAHVHNYKQSISKYFQEIYLMHNLLKAKNIKHYFFNVFPISFSAPFDLETEFSSWINKYNSELSSNAMAFDNTFFNFINNLKTEGKVKVTLNDGHPNVLGYKMWADVIIEDIKKKKILNK